MSQVYHSSQMHALKLTHQNHERPALEYHRGPPSKSRRLPATAPRKPARNIRAVALGVLIGVTLGVGAWLLVSRTYAAFVHDMRTRHANEQAQIQFAYEDRIAELRAQIDRITGQQLLDQGQVEQKLDALLKRQELLEQHTSALSGNMSPQSGKRKGAARSPVSNASKYNDKVSSLDQVLARVALGLDEVDQYQTTALSRMEEDANSKLRLIHGALAKLGVDSLQTKARANVGGPFVPLKAPQRDANAFDRQLYGINVTRAKIDGYKLMLAAVPLHKPVTGEIDESSPFGVRSDPFFHRPAMHTGIDLRGDTGDTVRATADGQVSIAGRDGGYGNLIEINHGRGLATRYGHLSEMDVKVGQRVHIGQIIGKIGSTGRSTGPHLHYETRINGHAVDPQKFLRAGSELGNL